MGEKQSEVVLFGTWSSSYCKKVELAFKLKGIPYKFVEEDLSNKSESLLRYNPVHKKVPVLVHKGKAVAESLVILEYIDETWTNPPRLLPEDPYERAKVRFWVEFFHRKIIGAFYAIVLSKGEEQEKAIQHMNELINVFQDGIERDFPARSRLFNDETLGLIDIIVAINACNYKALHEVIGVVLSPEKKTPKEFIAWIKALKQHPLVKETLPPHDKFVAALRKAFSPPSKVDDYFVT